jgi:hypothetical protein
VFEPRQVTESEYRELVTAVRRHVVKLVPEGATVLVVSKGDDELLRLDGRDGWHFPQTEGGLYAGHHPPDGGAAVDHLEDLRARGAQFLVMPSTSFWWLNHYPELRDHLERRYGALPVEEDSCLVFDLRAPREASASELPVTLAQARRAAAARQLRQLVESLLPSDAALLVLDDGREPALDAALGERARRCPPERLESALRGAADYLLVPRSAAELLEELPGLRRMIERSGRLVTLQRHVCSIYEIGGPS